MPRGRGKKENYNFDYSRFSAANEDGYEVVVGRDDDNPAPEDIIRQMPGELQEAFRLMQIAKQSGDARAQERANELAMMAVEKGGPDVKQRFQQELLRQAASDPQAKRGIEAFLNSAAPVIKPPSGGGNTLDKLSDTIASLTEKMTAGQEQAQEQMRALEQQQAALEQMQGPEDFGRFMAEQGLTQDDIQRAMAGDEEHMKRCMEKAVAKLDPPQADKRTEAMDKVLDAVDDLHTTLHPDGAKTRQPTRDLPAEAPAPRSPAARSAAVEAPRIAEHRLQYHKDESGCFQGLELRTALPGVLNMDAIEVDVSEKHVRLRTIAPAFVVNVGPFPGLVDASTARAKFSKKRQELTLKIAAK